MKNIFYEIKNYFTMMIMNFFPVLSVEGSVVSTASLKGGPDLMQKNLSSQKTLFELSDMFGLGSKENSEKENVSAENKNKENSAPVKKEKKSPAPSAEGIAKDRITVIGEGMAITGSIENSGDIEIYGSVSGNICGRNISVYGNVQGDINAYSVQMHGASVKGSIVCENDVVIDEDASLTDGKLSAKNLYCNSRIVGDIVVSEKLSLDAKAYVEGNITCKSIKVAEGASVKGSVSM